MWKKKRQNARADRQRPCGWIVVGKFFSFLSFAGGGAKKEEKFLILLPFCIILMGPERLRAGESGRLEVATGDSPNTRDWPQLTVTGRGQQTVGQTFLAQMEAATLGPLE